MLVDLSRAVGAYLQDVFITKLDWWVFLGFVAQGLFTMRFLVQWIASERAGRSVIPLGFWYFLHRRRPVASGLCAVPQGSGLHRRPGVRRLRLSAQSLFRPARAQDGGSVSALKGRRAPPRRRGRSAVLPEWFMPASLGCHKLRPIRHYRGNGHFRQPLDLAARSFSDGFGRGIALSVPAAGPIKAT